MLYSRSVASGCLPVGWSGKVSIGAQRAAEALKNGFVASSVIEFRL